MSDALDVLLAPRSVALVGASEDVSRIGGRPLRYLRDSGFAGRVLPVNPKRETVQGLPAWPSISALPETPDTAILAVPAAATLAAVEECAARGVRSAMIFSAGFAETGADYLMLHVANLRNLKALLADKPRNKTIMFWDFDDRMVLVHRDPGDRLWGTSRWADLAAGLWYQITP